MTKFCGIYSSIECSAPLGSKPLNWVNQAKTLFQDQTGKSFTFERAWLELRDAPKWKLSLDKSPAPTIIGAQDTPTPTPSANHATPSATVPSTPAESDSAPASNDSRRPGGVKSAKRALTHTEFMYKKIKLMESSTSETLKMSQKRYYKMARANDIQERVVDMEVL